MMLKMTEMMKKANSSNQESDKECKEEDDDDQSSSSELQNLPRDIPDYLVFQVALAFP